MTIAFLDKKQLKKIAIGAGIAMAGAGLTYLSDMAEEINWGVWSPIVGAGFSVVINFLRKLSAQY